MKTINVDTTHNVDGAGILDWALGELAGYALGRALKGDVDYVGAMNDSGCGTGYCTLGS